MKNILRGETTTIEASSFEEPAFTAPEPHYHSWQCGCKSRLEKDAFVIIPCSETCELYQAVLEEGTKNEIILSRANDGDTRQELS